MFDTMTITKVLGAVFGSLLVFLLGNWAASSLYATGGGHGGSEPAYVIETETETQEAGPAEEGPTFDALFAAADADAGEKVFAKCRACHKVDGTNGTGPHLNGVVDRAKASVEGFRYSDALLGMASDTWTPANIDAFLTNPKAYAPGTKMGFAGLPKPEDRVNLIAWLSTQP